MHPRLELDVGWRDLIWAAIGRRRAQVALPPDAVVGLSVRTLFDALLVELALPAAAGIAMSAVTVHDMAAIVRAHGHGVQPVDIDLDTLAPEPAILEAAIGSQSRVFVLAQLYGARAGLADVAAICRARGVLLIEDAAQAFDGRLGLAEGADVSLYSFGPIKTSTALGGGLAFIRDPNLAARMRLRLDGYPQLSERWFRRRARKYVALKLFNMPWLYGLIVRGLEQTGRDPDRVVGGMARGFVGQDLMRAIRHRPPAALLQLLAARLAAPKGVGSRATRGEALYAALGPSVERPGRLAIRPTHWLAPILAADPGALVRRLRAAGFDATRGATSMRSLADADHPCPNADRLIAQAVYLPSGPSMGARAVERLATVVREALRL